MAFLRERSAPSRPGFRLTISRAGDWTSRLIDEKPSHLWVKGIPTAGVGNIDQLFRKVLWVATGSGIGPCLPHLLARTAPAQLVWSTREPARTYGDELLNEIRSSVPDAVVWDTSADGKPDLLKIAYEAYLGSGAEAVICISNRQTTWSLVEGFEQRGVPAFGAIWDS
jgi:ferredoxin-NADP reductase